MSPVRRRHVREDVRRRGGVDEGVRGARAARRARRRRRRACAGACARPWPPHPRPAARARSRARRHRDAAVVLDLGAGARASPSTRIGHALEGAAPPVQLEGLLDETGDAPRQARCRRPRCRPTSPATPSRPRGSWPGLDRRSGAVDRQPDRRQHTLSLTELNKKMIDK